MSEAPRRRLRKGRLVVAGGLLALLIAALLFLRCGDQLGLGGGDGEAPEVDTPGADAAPPAADAAPARCRLRLDGDGLTLAGRAVTVEEAVRGCQAAGAADLVVTGDASFGLRERIRSALREAGIPLYEN